MPRNDTRSPSPQRLSTLHELTEPNSSTYTNDPENRSSRHTFNSSIRNSLRSLSTTPFSYYPSTEHSTPAKPEEVVIGQAKIVHLNRPEEGWYKKFRNIPAFWPILAAGLICLILVILSASVSIWEVARKSATVPMNMLGVVNGTGVSTVVRSVSSAVPYVTDSSGACTTADGPATTTYHRDWATGTTLLFTTNVTPDAILSSLLIIPISNNSTFKSLQGTSTRSDEATTTTNTAPTSIYYTVRMGDRGLPTSTSDAAGYRKGQAFMAMILCLVALFILYDER